MHLLAYWHIIGLLALLVYWHYWLIGRYWHVLAHWHYWQVLALLAYWHVLAYWHHWLIGTIGSLAPIGTVFRTNLI